MPKLMKATAGLSFAACIFTAVGFRYSNKDIYLTLAITFGTIAYHMGIRLLVGLAFGIRMKNKADYTKKWYQIRPWENKLYQLLQVKKWKGKLPTYDPDSFSSGNHTWDEIAQTMCQSELVHETNIILSFIPVTASVYFGAFYVFFITSAAGAAFDLLFVMIQRYNRPRIIKIAQRKRC